MKEEGLGVGKTRENDGNDPYHIWTKLSNLILGTRQAERGAEVKFGSVYRFCFPVCRTLMLHFVAELWKISEMDSPSPGLCYNFPYFSWIWVFNLMPKYTLYCLLILTSFAELDQSLQGLLSFERLDRASPDLWPEQSESILFQD